MAFAGQGGEEVKRESSRSRQSENFYDLFRSSLESFERALEVEADRRLYVTPALTMNELLALHVLHCSSMATGKEPKLRQVAASLGLSEGYVSQLAKTLRSAGFLGATFRPTPAYGVPAVSVVQYVHRAWVEQYFSSEVFSARHETFVKVDRGTYLPTLLMLVRELMFALDLRIKKLTSLSLDDAMLLVLMADFHRSEKRFATVRELSNLTRRKTDYLYERAPSLRKFSLVTRIDFDLTSAGAQLAESLRKEAENWSFDIRARLLDG